jgi:hypothetical protein
MLQAPATIHREVVMQTIRSLALLLLLSAIPIPAQTPQPAPNAVRATMDAQSAALVPKALAALNAATTLTGVTLTGTVMRTVGSDPETGTTWRK